MFCTTNVQKLIFGISNSQKNEIQKNLKLSMIIPIISQIMLNFARIIESYVNKEEFDR
jgi:hypothetical protein